jgi:hypothetical protein
MAYIKPLLFAVRYLRLHKSGVEINLEKSDIKSLLSSRIDWAGTLLVLVGKETHSRFWVNWKIEYANGQGKRIVGIYARGAKESDIPKNLDRYGDALVGWDSGNLIDAIRGRHHDWVTPDGQPRKGLWEPSRSKC